MRPERAALDRPFDVDLTASYYAGGRVAARPIAWRVTQFPYEWTPKARTGFFYSSDGRFSRVARFESTPALERSDSTDESGSARLALNPAVEATAQPRTYVVEATVVGADDQTVTSTRSIVALPPFVLGLEVPRYVERATGSGPLRPRFLVVGPDDKPIAGQKVTVRLIHRQWHAHLRASDFSDGVARYITEVVDEKVLERQVVSSADAQAIELELPEAGVYVVELEAHDRLGRAQTVAVDLFAGGGEPVAWEKPPAAVFQVTPDKAKYEPGDTARLVLQSPFQSGEALAVVEAPDGNRYSWLPVRGGQATFELAVEGDVGAASAGALPADARPARRDEAGPRQRHRSRAPVDLRRHRLARGRAQGQPRRRRARISRTRPAGAGDRDRNPARGPRRRAARGRSDALAGRPGGARARARSAARSAALVPRRGALLLYRRATRAR